MFASYNEAYFKIDKFMPDDKDIQDEFYKIIDEKKVDELVEFIENNVNDEERMYSYFPENGTILEFANHIIFTVHAKKDSV